MEIFFSWSNSSAIHSTILTVYAFFFKYGITFIKLYELANNNNNNNNTFFIRKTKDPLHANKHFPPQTQTHTYSHVYLYADNNNNKKNLWHWKWYGSSWFALCTLNGKCTATRTQMFILDVLGSQRHNFGNRKT